jgi:hypothetical protein
VRGLPRPAAATSLVWGLRAALREPEPEPEPVALSDPEGWPPIQKSCPSPLLLSDGRACGDASGKGKLLPDPLRPDDVVLLEEHKLDK